MVYSMLESTNRVYATCLIIIIINFRVDRQSESAILWISGRLLRGGGASQADQSRVETTGGFKKQWGGASQVEQNRVESSLLSI